MEGVGVFARPTHLLLVELLLAMAAGMVEQEVTEIVQLLEPAVVVAPVATPEREVEGVTLALLQPLRMV
jgi:hypothetical protein